MVKLKLASQFGFKFGQVAALGQLMFTFIMFFRSDYGMSVNTKQLLIDNNTVLAGPGAVNPSSHVYPFFQDVQCMMLIGMAFLFCYLKYYGLSSLAYNLYLCGFGLQWALIMNGVRETVDGKILTDVVGLVKAQFSITAVLISYGAVLGKVSGIQLSIMALAEIPLIAWNQYIGEKVLLVSDTGCAMYAHMFGAYFGLGMSFVLTKRGAYKTHRVESVYHSDMLAMLGTLTLWVFWPSYNAALAKGEGQPRAVVNTFLCLCASVCQGFGVASLVTDHSKDIDEKTGERVNAFTGKLYMQYIRLVTISGGVAVSGCADLMLGNSGAQIIGVLAGIISILGSRYLTPWLNRYAHDTCGVHNLHGIPGLLGGFSTATAAAMSSLDTYGKGLYIFFPAMAPTDVTSLYLGTTSITGGLNRNRFLQAAFQIAAMAITLAISIVGGMITGLVLRFVPGLEQPAAEMRFDDEVHWELPETCVAIEPVIEKTISESDKPI